MEDHLFLQAIVKARTILLDCLAEEIDGTDLYSRMVGAYIIGGTNF